MSVSLGKYLRPTARYLQTPNPYDSEPLRYARSGRGKSGSTDGGGGGQQQQQEAPAPAARTVQTITTVATSGGSTTAPRYINPMSTTAALSTPLGGGDFSFPFDCLIDSISISINTAPGLGHSYICRMENNLTIPQFVVPAVFKDKNIEYLDVKLSDTETSGSSSPSDAILYQKGEALRLGIHPVGTAATGTITVTNVIAGDVLTVNGLTFTAVNGVKTSDIEFSADGTDTEVAIDLANSITEDIRTAGKTFLDNDVKCTASGNVITVTATSLGTPSHVIDLSSPDTTIVVSGATLAGATDPTPHGSATITFKIWSPEGKQAYFGRHPTQPTSISESAAPLVNTTNAVWNTTLNTYDFAAQADGVISDLTVTRDVLPTGSDSMNINIYNVTQDPGLVSPLSITVDSDPELKLLSLSFFRDEAPTLSVTSGDILRLTSSWNGASARLCKTIFAFTPTTPGEDLTTGSAPNSITTEGPISNMTFTATSANTSTTGFRVKFIVREHRRNYSMQVATDFGFSNIVFTSGVKDSISFNGGKGVLMINTVEFDATGLLADTQYYYRLVTDGTIDTGYVGECKTFPSIVTPVTPVTDSIIWGSCLDLAEDAGDVPDTDRYSVKVVQRMTESLASVIIDLGDRAYSDNPLNALEERTRPLLQYLNHPVLKESFRKKPWAYQTSDHDSYGGGGDTNLTMVNVAALSPWPDPDQSAVVTRDAIQKMVALWDNEVPTPAGALVEVMANTFDIRRVRHVIMDTQFARYKNTVGTMIGDGSSQVGANHTATETPNQKQWVIDQINSAATDGIKLLALYGGGAKPNGFDGFLSPEWIAEFRDICNVIRDSDVEVVFLHGDLHHSGVSSVGDGSESPAGLNRYDVTGSGRFATFACAPFQDSIVDGISDWNTWGSVPKTGSHTKSKYGVLLVTDNGDDDLDYTVENRNTDGDLMQSEGRVGFTQWSNRDNDRELNFTASTDSVASGAGTYSLRVLKSWLGQGRFHVASTGTGSTLIDSNYETKPNAAWLDISITLTGSGTTTFTLTVHSVNSANSSIGVTNSLELTIT